MRSRASPGGPRGGQASSKGAIAPSRIDREAIGDDAAHVQLDRTARALTSRAGADRTVIPEEVRLGLTVIGAAAATVPAANVCVCLAVGQDPAAVEPLLECGFDRIGPPRDGVPASDQSIDDDIDRTFLGQRKNIASVVERNRLTADAGSRESLAAERVEQRKAVGRRLNIDRESDLVTNTVCGERRPPGPR